MALVEADRLLSPRQTYMLLVLLLETSTAVRTIIEVSVASLPWRQSIKRPMHVLEQPENDYTLALEYLLFCPGELLAHLAGGLKNFHSFPDVRQARGLCLRILEDSSDPNLENAADESTE